IRQQSNCNQGKSTRVIPAMVTSALLQESQSNTFVCDCGESYRRVCKGEEFYKESAGKRYCVLHYPGKEKAEEFKVALEKKLESKNFDFALVWFPDHVDFRGFDFSADVNFGGATFSAGADFSRAIFSAGAYFPRATFSAGADFSYATFSAGASFNYAT